MSSGNNKTEKTFEENFAPVNKTKRFFRVLFTRKVVIFGAIIIVIFVLTAMFAPFIAPYDPYKQDLRSAVMQPCKEHPLGTDALGRDTLSRIIYGSRTSIMVGVVALAIAAVIGMIMGLVAGYFGGMTNALIMRFTDAMMAFPLILLALIIAAVLGGGLRNVMIALGIGLIPGYCRLMCGQVLSVKENDYILASKALGSHHVRIMLAHILPNCFPPLIVLITLTMGNDYSGGGGIKFSWYRY